MWSEGKCAGVALGGLLWGDRTLAHAVAALPAQAVAAAADELSKLDIAERPEQKQRLVRELVEEVRGHSLLQAEQLPPRARALLARHVPREQGRRLLLDAPEARPDFVAPNELVQMLLHIARTPQRIESFSRAEPPASTGTPSEQDPHVATPAQH